MTEKTYTGKEFAPVFYRAMVEWHDGGCVGDDPRECWQQELDEVWVAKPCVPAFTNVAYRWKPKQKRMVTIGYRDKIGNLIKETLVAPETVAPAEGTNFWLMELSFKDSFSWGGGRADEEWLADGQVFLTQEDAQAMSDWLAVCRKGGAT